MYPQPPNRFLAYLRRRESLPQDDEHINRHLAVAQRLSDVKATMDYGARTGRVRSSYLLTDDPMTKDQVYGSLGAVRGLAIEKEEQDPAYAPMLEEVEFQVMVLDHLFRRRAVSQTLYEELSKKHGDPDGLLKCFERSEYTPEAIRSGISGQSF